MRRSRRRATDEDRRPPAQDNVVRVPHDSVNEMVLLAAVVVDLDLRERYLRTTQADMFYGTGHAALWRAMQELDRRGLSYDPMTLRQLGGPELDVDYLENLIGQRPLAPPNIKHHVEMLHWDHARVMTAKGPLTRLLEMLKDPKTDESSLRQAAKQVVDGLSSGRSRTLRNNRQLIEEHMLKVTERRSGRATWGFGIDGLDYYEEGATKLVGSEVLSIGGQPRLVPGTAPGMVTCVTGVSGSCKTTMTARGVLGMIKQGRRVAYGAYEQGSGMTLELMAEMSLGMSRTDMMTGKFSDDDERELREEMERLGEHVMFDEIPFERFATREGNPNARAIDRIAQAMIDSRCEVYVADLFQRQLSETRPEDDDLALRGVQHVAASLGVHLILVQQQKLKDVEATKSKLPRRDSIKGVSTWVDVSDQIIAWHLPALWKNVPNDRIHALIVKQRHGPWPLQVEFDYDPEYATIEGGRSVEIQRDGDAQDDEMFGEEGWGPKR